MFETVATVTEGPVLAMMQALTRVKRRLLANLTEQAMEKMMPMNMMIKKAAVLPPTTAPIFTVREKGKIFFARLKIRDFWLCVCKKASCIHLQRRCGQEPPSSKHKNVLSKTLTTALFIAIVSTVIDSVALVILFHTLSIAT